MVSNQIVGKVPLAPTRSHRGPSIVAHEQARIATCENGMRLFGMGD
jgi:hypothetical protein